VQGGEILDIKNITVQGPLTLYAAFKKDSFNKYPLTENEIII
jgi:hypothetical protein